MLVFLGGALVLIYFILVFKLRIYISDNGKMPTWSFVLPESYSKCLGDIHSLKTDSTMK